MERRQGVGKERGFSIRSTPPHITTPDDHVSFVSSDDLLRTASPRSSERWSARVSRAAFSVPLKAVPVRPSVCGNRTRLRKLWRRFSARTRKTACGTQALPQSFGRSARVSRAVFSVPLKAAPAHSSVCGSQTGWRELCGRFSARRGKQPAGRRRSLRASARA